MTKTVVTVTVLGGPECGWHGRIRVPLDEERDDRIRLKSGLVYRVHRQAGRMFLVHPSAQRLIWP